MERKLKNEEKKSFKVNEVKKRKRKITGRTKERKRKYIDGSNSGNPVNHSLVDPSK